MENSKVKRGEIYLYDFGCNTGSIQNGVRPVMVVQCDEGNQTSPTTVVAAITTIIKKQYLPSHIFLNDNFGLHKPSMVMLEQLKTVNQEELTRYIGRIDNEYVLKRIDIGLKKAVGLWVERPSKRKQEVRCLCRKCLNDYINSGDYIVKRLDLFATEKGECDKCRNDGWEYIVIQRNADHREKRYSNGER